MHARRLFELNTTALIFERTRSSEMNVKSIAGQLGERRTRFALSSDAAHPLADHWSVSDFVALTKPRVMMLAVFTALVGLSSAPVRLDPLTTLAAVLAIAAGAGAAGALNMWYDADIDAVMSRTAMRPIPRGKVSRFEALVFGLVLGGFAVVVLTLATNLTAAALLAGTILFYIVVYTAWLKRATRQNIVIGGAAGALLNPTSAVKTASIITRGFVRATKSDTLQWSASG